MINDKNVTFMLEMNVECVYLNYMNVIYVWNNHMPDNAWKMLNLVWMNENQWINVISLIEWIPAFVAGGI